MSRKLSFLQNYMTNLRQIVSLFADSFSGDFADEEAPGDDSCNTKNLPGCRGLDP